MTALANKRGNTRAIASKKTRSGKRPAARAKGKGDKSASLSLRERFFAFAEKGEPWPRVMGAVDPVLMATLVLLVAFGVVMVFSASAILAERQLGDPFFYLKRQGVFALLGLGAMTIAARVDYHRYRAIVYPALGLSVVLLLMVLVGFGRSAGGATRWIQVGSINIQPAELTKLSLILWLAYSLSKKQDRIRSFSVGFLPHALMAGFLMLLCLKQPDFGSAVMLALLTFVLLFAAGAKTGYLLGAVLAAAPVAYWLVAGSEYRMRRIQAFLSPFEHRHDIGYQISESLMSFGAGGATGVGLGDSKQKLFFLPEAHTDFVSAIVGEELGFLGVTFLIGLFVVVVFRGMRASFRAPDEFGNLLALGITMFIGLQAFTNLAVTMGLVPTKGLALPFMSYGGSSILVNCAAAGVLLNVSRPREGERLIKGKASRRKRRHGRARDSQPGVSESLEDSGEVLGGGAA